MKTNHKTHSNRIYTYISKQEKNDSKEGKNKKKEHIFGVVVVDELLLVLVHHYYVISTLLLFEIIIIKFGKIREDEKEKFPTAHNPLNPQ